MIRDKSAEESARILAEILEDTKGLGRREFLSRLGQAAAGSALLAGVYGLSSGAASAAEREVSTMGFGAAWKDATFKAYFDPFTQRTGIPIKYVTPYKFAKLVAMHEAGRQEIDTLQGGALDTSLAVDKGLAAKLDWNVIDRSQLTPNQLEFGDYVIGSITLSYVLCYNKRKWPGADHPKSFADFWDVDRFPGPRAMQRRVYPAVEAALMADGVPTEAGSVYPIDYDRAYRKLDEIKPHISVWYTSGAQQQQLVQDEEVDLLIMWNGRAGDSIYNKGANFEIVWNQAVYIGNAEGWVLLKDSPNPEGAMKLLDFVGRPEPQAAFAKALYYGPLNLNAYKHIDPEFGKRLPSHPDNTKVALEWSYKYWNQHYEEANKQFNEWLTV